MANNGGGNQRGRTPQKNNKTGGVQQRLTLQRPGAGRVQQQQQQQRKNNNNQQKQAKGRRGKRGIRPGGEEKERGMNVGQRFNRLLSLCSRSQGSCEEGGSRQGIGQVHVQHEAQ